MEVTRVKASFWIASIRCEENSDRAYERVDRLYTAKQRPKYSRPKRELIFTVSFLVRPSRLQLSATVNFEGSAL